jgi:serine/threonine protein kinase
VTRLITDLQIYDNISFDERLLQFAETEVKILKRVRHPHIVHMHEAKSFKDSIVLVLENCTHGDLMRDTVLSAAAPNEAAVFRHIIKQVLLALHALHSEVCSVDIECLLHARHPCIFWTATRAAMSKFHCIVELAACRALYTVEYV